MIKTMIKSPIMCRLVMMILDDDALLAKLNDGDQSHCM